MRLFLFKLALINVFRKRVRAFLTIGGIALSIGIMVFMFGLGAGLQAMVDQQVSKTGLRDVISVESKNSQQLVLDQTAVAKIQSMTGVSDVQGVMNTSGLITYNGVSLVLPVYAVTPDFFETTPVDIKEGDTKGQLTENSRNIILSRGAVEAFGGNTSPLNKPVSVKLTINKDIAPEQSEASRELSQVPFTAKAVVDRGKTPVAYVPTGYLQRNGATTYSELKARVTSPSGVATARESIEQLGFQTNNVQDAISQVDRIFSVIRGILIAFAIVTVAITVFGTINTITIQLVEETRQIGFLRIMGIRKEHVGRLFVMQSMIISVLGTLVGIIAGSMFGFVANGISQTSTSDIASNGDILHVFSLPLPHITVMLILSVLLGWVIGLTPAKSAVKLNPLAAIKS